MIFDKDTAYFEICIIDKPNYYVTIDTLYKGINTDEYRSKNGVLSKKSDTLVLNIGFNLLLAPNFYKYFRRSRFPMTFIPIKNRDYDEFIRRKNEHLLDQSCSLLREQINTAQIGAQEKERLNNHLSNFRFEMSGRKKPSYEETKLLIEQYKKHLLQFLK